MSSDATPLAGQRQSRREIVALQLVVGLFLALRLYFDLTADLFGDEAYYWMWGQNPGWSYFDHPPLNAWLLHVVSLVTGWAPFGPRLLTWVTLAGVLAIFAAWARRLAPNEPSLWFWRSAAIYLASPMFFGMTMIAYNDHLLVALSLLAVHCFAVFVDRAETGAPRHILWLYLAAGALGLAMLSKYNGIFVGFGFAATFVLRPRLRPLLRTPHPWLAALLALAMQAPVIWWNASQRMASFRYHLDDRWGGHAGQINWMNPVNFLLLTVILWSPFLIWPLVRLIRARLAAGFEDGARTLTLATLVLSTLTFLVISMPLGAYFYWNIVAFVGLMPMLTRFTGPWLRLGHYAFGLFCAALIVCNFAVTPVGPLVGIRDPGSSINYGWGEIADHVRAAEAKAPTDLVAATRYSTTSQLGFALGISNAAKLSPEHSQYDYWQADAPLAGKSALILIDEKDNSPVLTFLTEHFGSFTEVDRFTITRFGRDLYKWRLFRGEDWRP